MSEGASIPREVIVGDLIVTRPTVGTVAVLARELRAANVDLDEFLASVTSDDANDTGVASKGLELILALADRLAPVLATVVKRGGKRLTVDEATELPADVAIEVVGAAVSLFDREAVLRLRDRVQSATK